jgi:hypothetical protein
MNKKEKKKGGYMVLIGVTNPSGKETEKNES